MNGDNDRTSAKNTMRKKSVTPQRAQFRPPQRVVKQHGEDRPVAFALQRVRTRRVQQLPRLHVGDRRGLALVGPLLRTLHALDRIVRDGVPLAQVIEQIGQRREFPPDGGC